MLLHLELKLRVVLLSTNNYADTKLLVDPELFVQPQHFSSGSLASVVSTNLDRNTLRYLRWDLHQPACGPTRLLRRLFSLFGAAESEIEMKAPCCGVRMSALVVHRHMKAPVTDSASKFLASGALYGPSSSVH